MGVYKRKNKESNTFSISGPQELIPIDWNNSYHRTAVTACLVNGVYTMQRDKAGDREPLADPWWEDFGFSSDKAYTMQRNKEPLAKPWWKYFGFSLDKTLINEADGSIYGAVFKYEKYDSYQNTPHLGIPPRYVIAFRGTSFSSETLFSDVKQDIRCLFDNLNEGGRFQHAIKAIETVLAEHTGDTKSVWLAGHSLGAGIALLAGKTMTRMGFPLETYAFNPPHSSLPLEKIFDCDIVKHGVRMATTLIKVTVTSLYDFKINEDDPRIAAWTPYLYVNPQDTICSEYIGDFKFKNLMSKLGASKIERNVSKFTLANLFFGEGSAEAIHLLSSFNIIVNKNKFTDFKACHGLQQWWEPDPARRENWESHEFR